MAIGDNEETEPLANSLVDEPPSYEAASGRQSNDVKLLLDPRTSHTQRSSRVSASCSPVTSKQVRQTICALIRNLVLDVDFPSNLLDSCVSACETYSLDFPSLLQEPFIERHSPIYWAILQSRNVLLPSLLIHAAPLSQQTISEIRLACLVTGNQDLFQSLRCKRKCSRNELTPLSMSCNADALVLGSMPSDEVSIRDIDHCGPFVADIRINLWQKRMRAVGMVSVEFIARGRIWSLQFISPSTVMGPWWIELGLLEHSPPTFISSELFITLPPSSSDMSRSHTSTPQGRELISLSPPPDGSRSPVSRSRPTSPTQSRPSESNESQPIELYSNPYSQHRIAYRNSNIHEQWTDHEGNTYINAIVIPLGEDGEVLMYDNAPFLGTDGTLHVRFEARLEKPN